MEANTRRQPPGVRPMISIVALTILIAGVVFADHEQAGQREIIVFREGTRWEVHRQVVEPHGLRVLHHLDLVNAVAAEIPDAIADKALAALQDDPLVAYIEPDQVTSAGHVVSITPVAPWLGEIVPWGVQKTGALNVLNLIASNTSSTPKVAIMDTGIDKNHPDLKFQIAGGRNVLAGGNPPKYEDDNGHGTHMAGIIAAAWNGTGIIGMADPTLVAVKVLDSTGHGLLSDLANGLQWVLEQNTLGQNIRVVNMSLSFPRGSQVLQQVTDQLYAQGVIMVASAGNRCAGGSEDSGADDEGGDTGCDAANAYIKYPAAYSTVVAVVATNNTIDNQLTAYDRVGPEVDLAAPGGDQQYGLILSTTINGGYGLGYGSSQAAAHVTGAAAVALQLAPGLSVDQVVALLKGTAKPLNDQHAGAGLVDVDKMVKSLLGLP
jgi:subtilisin